MGESFRGRFKAVCRGRGSSNPDEWKRHGDRALVIAHDEEEAVSMVDFSRLATEIRLRKPQVLLIETLSDGL
jgi:hypothetical protein